MSACSSSHTVKSSNRYTESNDWLGQQLDRFQKDSLPWIATATRVTLLAAGLFLAPCIAASSFTTGVAVGYKWPGAYDMNPAHISAGCSKDFYDTIANRQQSKAIGLIFATVTTLYHMRCHGRGFYVFLATYAVGQYVGKELNAFANSK